MEISISFIGDKNKFNLLIHRYITMGKLNSWWLTLIPYSTSNAKTPGLLDETEGVPIQQFVGLRSKMYWIKYGRMEQKRANGIVKPVVKKELT
jgi:hypothetical protein